MNSDDDTRLGSTVLDLNDFQRSPLVGTGPSDETRYGKSEVLFMRTNGLADLLVRIGLIGFVFVCAVFYRSLKKYFSTNEIIKPKTTAYIFLLLTFLISLSETYFNMPFFWSLFLLQYAERIPPIDTYEIVDI
jgi:O-antigen ligase